MRRLPLSVVTAVAILAAGASTAGAAVDPVVNATAQGPNPFAACTAEPARAGVRNFPNSEPEPYVDVDPGSASSGSARMIGVWQQDRWSNGGAKGLGTGISSDGGDTWQILQAGQLPRFTICSGGTPSNGGDYERASDPWVQFSPNGNAHQVALSFNDVRNFHNAIIVSKSTDGGQTWSANKVIRRDTSPTVFNDKETLTADPFDSRYVYVVWDRLVFPTERAEGQSFENAAAFKGPTWFSRSTDGGDTYEPAREIFDPGRNDQTIGNQIVVMPATGDLVNIYTLFRNDNRAGLRGGSIAVLRSTDRGATWSSQIVVDRLGAVGVTDPRDGAAVRTGDIIPEISSDERGAQDAKCPTGDCVYAVWQDARFTAFERDQIAFSKSTDGGRSWSAPVRINTRADTQAFTPMVKVDDEGNIGVTHYDFRNDTTASPTLETDAWFLRSSDGGAHWSEERITPASFDMRTAPYARGYFVGDYEGLTAIDDTFMPFFTQSMPPPSDSRIAPSPNPTDVFSTTARQPFGPATFTPSAGPAAAAFPARPGGKPRQR